MKRENYMVWFLQLFKFMGYLMKVLIDIAKHLEKLAENKASSNGKINVEVIEKEPELPEIIEEIEVFEEPKLPVTKEHSVSGDVLGFVGIVAGLLGVIYIINKFVIPTYPKAQKTLTGQVKYFKVDEGLLSFYKEGSGPPLIMIHGINPGASSHEMEVIFNNYRTNRTVYSLDMLGYGLSERPEIEYSTNMYTQHIHEFIEYVKTLHNTKPDVIALGLTTEYLVTIANASPELLNKIILITPTGLENKVKRLNSVCRRVAVNFFKLPIVGQGAFNLLTSKTFMNKYLARRIFVEPRNISYLMLQQYYYTTHVAGAKNAPPFIISGDLVVENLLQKYLNLKTPTLVIWGTGCEDCYKLESIKAIMRDNNNIDEKVIEKGGLLSHIEKPDQFFNASDKFLNSNH